MHDEEMYSGRTARHDARIKLGDVRELIHDCAREISETGLDREKVTELIAVTRDIHCSLPPLDPLVSCPTYYYGGLCRSKDGDRHGMPSTHERVALTSNAQAKALETHYW